MRRFNVKQSLAISLSAIRLQLIAGSSNGRTQDFGSWYRVSNPCPAAILRQGYGVALLKMYYVYILYSSKSKNFYYGFTANITNRLNEHNSGLSKATAPFKPWKLVWYCAFETEKLAKDFEHYIKSGSGKAFAYRRLVNTALMKDVKRAEIGTS